MSVSVSISDKSQSMMTGPKLKFEDGVAEWTGEDFLMHGNTFYEKYIFFHATVSTFANKTIFVSNIGSTVLYYQWEKVFPKEFFEEYRSRRRTKRFFFDVCPGTLTPGRTKEMQLSFYSNEAGFYCETWQFSTKPVLCGGGAILLQVRGVASPRIDYSFVIRKMEEELAHRQAGTLVTYILRQLVYTACKSKQTDRKEVVNTEEEKFERANPHLYYHRRLVEILQVIYDQTPSTSESKLHQWDYKIDTLLEAIQRIPNPTMHQELSDQVDEILQSLEHPRYQPLVAGSYQIVYLLLCQMIEAIVDEAGYLEHTLKVSCGSFVMKKRLDDGDKEVDNRNMKNKKSKFHHMFYLSVYSLMSSMVLSMGTNITALHLRKDDFYRRSDNTFQKVQFCQK